VQVTGKGLLRCAGIQAAPGTFRRVNRSKRAYTFNYGNSQSQPQVRGNDGGKDERGMASLIGHDYQHRPGFGLSAKGSKCVISDQGDRRS
jgi:hypothetical protein